MPGEKRIRTHPRSRERTTTRKTPTSASAMDSASKTTSSRLTNGHGTTATRGRTSSSTSLWSTVAAEFASSSNSKKLKRNVPEIVDLTASSSDDTPGVTTSEERNRGLLVYMMGTSNYEPETIRQETKPVLWKSLEDKHISVQDICWADKSIPHKEDPNQPPRTIYRDAFIVDQAGQVYVPDQDWETCSHTNRTVTPLCAGPGRNSGIRFTSISVCEEHMAGISKERKLYTWGKGGEFKLGHGSEDNEAYPRKVFENKKGKSLPSMKQVACNNFSTLALDVNGKMWSFGWNNRFETGRGGIGHGHTKWPKPVKVKGNLQVSSVTACNGRCGALTKQGRVYTWGFGRHGALGHGETEDTPEPRLIEALKVFEIQSLSCGWCHMGACTKDGWVLTWGSNQSGQLGIGLNSDEEEKHSPTRVTSLKDEAMESISCGHSHTGVLSQMGDMVYTWGANNNGELGHGSEHYKETVAEPRRVVFDNETNGKIVKIECRNFYSAILVDPCIPMCAHGKPIKSILSQNDFSEPEGTFQDVELDITNKGHDGKYHLEQMLYAHRFVLANRCKYFSLRFSHADDQVLQSAPMRNGRVVIDIQDCDSSIFILILDYLYEKKLMVSKDQVILLYQKADFFLLPGLSNQCKEILQNLLTNENCFKLRSAAHQAAKGHPPCEDLVAICEDFVVSNQIDIADANE